MRPRTQPDPTQETSTAAPKAPGAFRPDGSYNEDGGVSDRGQIDQLVRALVNARRNDRLSVERAVLAIRAANGEGAFPSLDQWERVNSWPMVPTSTAAEEAVKREGRSYGHWCGERWMPGSESDCQESRHRSLPRRRKSGRWSQPS